MLGPNFTLHQLRCFLAVVRYGTITAAADALELAQPSVSEQIRTLEVQLGVRLFSRAGRSVILTEAGRGLVPHAEQVLDSVAGTADWAQSERLLEGGVATIGTYGVAYLHFVDEVVSTFVAAHPSMRVRIVGQNSSEVIEMVGRGELECGFVMLPGATQGLSVRKIAREEHLFATTLNPEDVSPLTIERLADLKVIHYGARFSDRDPSRRQLATRAGATGVTVRAAIEVETLESAMRLASLGLGGFIVSATAARAPSFPANLNLVPFSPPLVSPIAYIQRKGVKVSAATRELAWLVERALTADAPQASSRGREAAGQRPIDR